MGLIKSGLKAAVFVKTAHVVHDRIERRQQAEWAAQGHPQGMAPGGPAPAQPQWAAPPQHPAIAQPTVLDQLTQLGELRTSGVLTDAEFEVQKARILAG
jgi:hypothetical protein